MNNSDRKSLAETNPELATEWDYDKNGNSTPQNVSRGSHKKVYWKCPHGHNYLAEIKSRAMGKRTRCPYCSGKKVLTGFNDLSSRSPEIAKQFSQLNHIDPSEVLVTSRRKYIWACEHGHYWSATPESRTRHPNCPYCLGRYATKENCLTALNPELAAQLHSTKNAGMTGFDLTSKSNKKVWWLCPVCGHEYQATVANRAKGRGCPECAKHCHTSFPEQAIYYYVKQVFPQARNGYKACRRELDIYVSDLQIAFEHNGMYYHKGKEEIDAAKVKLFKERGVRVITIKEGEKNVVDGDVIEYSYRNRMKGSLDWMIKEVLSRLGATDIHVDVKADTDKIRQQYIPSAKPNTA